MTIAGIITLIPWASEDHPGSLTSLTPSPCPLQECLRQSSVRSRLLGIWLECRCISNARDWRDRLKPPRLATPLEMLARLFRHGNRIYYTSSLSHRKQSGVAALASYCGEEPNGVTSFIPRRPNNCSICFNSPLTVRRWKLAYAIFQPCRPCARSKPKMLFQKIGFIEIEVWGRPGDQEK